MKPTLFRLLWRLKHFGDRDILETLRRIERNQWLSQDELSSLAWEKQKRLVTHAYASSPYYRKKYGAIGFQPGDLKTPEDFSRLPVLTKEEIREHIDEMVSDGVDASIAVKRFTGGSTGIPLMVYHDSRADLPVWGLHLRTIGRWGLRLGDKIAHVWGLNRLNQEFLHDTQSPLSRALKNYVLLDAYEMSPTKMEEFAELLRAFRPNLLIGYVSAMTAFAQYLENSGGAGFAPSAVWLTSEPTHDFQREIVERTYGAPVYDQYGSVEIHHCAVECANREGLHLEADFRTIEVVDEDGRPLPAGEAGLVTVTDLLNFAAPLIRYRNEDYGSLLAQNCSCGRSLPLMSKVTGRIYDMFHLPDGSQIYGHRFTTFFYDHVDAVTEFQVHQVLEDQVIVRLVPTSRCNRETLSAQVLKSFREYTRGQVTFDIQFVDGIAKEASGKFRFAKSDVRKSG